MRSDADGSVSFNGLYLAGLDILLTHTHTQGTWRNYTYLVLPLRAREACRKPLQTKGSREFPLFFFSYPLTSVGKRNISIV